MTESGTRLVRRFPADRQIRDSPHLLMNVVGPSFIVCMWMWVHMSKCYVGFIRGLRWFSRHVESKGYPLPDPAQFSFPMINGDESWYVCLFPFSTGLFSLIPLNASFLQSDPGEYVRLEGSLVFQIWGKLI